MKRKITPAQKEFLERELEYLRSVHADMKASELDKYYQVMGKKSSRMQAMLWVGAVLVGIGFLSLIASNWSSMNSSVKFILVLTGVMTLYFAGWKTENSLPKTSRSLYYLGGILFGAGIFLIGQAFHLGGAIYPAFLLWSIGIIPMAYYLKDKAVLSFSILLLYVYNSEIIFESYNPAVLFILIPAIYAINHRVLNRSRVIFVLNSLLLLQFIHSQLWHYGTNHFLIIICLFLVGVIISIKPIKGYRGISKAFGYIMQGVYGIVLTFPDTWEMIFGSSVSEWSAILFAVLYGLYIIFMVKEGDLFPILILSGIIFRFYVDISYDFLPRGLFFILGGLVLIAFGIWFEWRRRKEINEDEHA